MSDAPWPSDLHAFIPWRRDARGRRVCMTCGIFEEFHSLAAFQAAEIGSSIPPQEEE